MSEVKMSQEQWQMIERLESSLSALHEWVADTLPTDTQLRAMIWQKIQNATNRLERLLNSN